MCVCVCVCVFVCVCLCVFMCVCVWSIVCLLCVDWKGKLQWGSVREGVWHQCGLQDGDDYWTSPATTQTTIWRPGKGSCCIYDYTRTECRISGGTLLIKFTVYVRNMLHIKIKLYFIPNLVFACNAKYSELLWLSIYACICFNSVLAFYLYLFLFLLD